MTITVECVAPQQAWIYKEIRLQALQDPSWAYGSTYERESHFSDEA